MSSRRVGLPLILGAVRGRPPSCRLSTLIGSLESTLLVAVVAVKQVAMVVSRARFGGGVRPCCLIDS